MGSARIFLPVPSGDSRLYLGSEACEDLLRKINSGLYRMRMPLVGSGEGRWMSEITTSLPKPGESFTVTCELSEGYRIISKRGARVKSEIPTSTVRLAREGDPSQDVIWKGLWICLFDAAGKMVKSHEVTHDGMIQFHPNLPPGLYTPQFVLPSQVPARQV